jgi:hypothetical protein
MIRATTSGEPRSRRSRRSESGRLLSGSVSQRAVVGLDVQATASVTSHSAAARASLTRLRRRYLSMMSKSWTTQRLFRAIGGTAVAPSTCVSTLGPTPGSLRAWSLFHFAGCLKLGNSEKVAPAKLIRCNQVERRPRSLNTSVHPAHNIPLSRQRSARENLPLSAFGPLDLGRFDRRNRWPRHKVRPLLCVATRAGFRGVSSDARELGLQIQSVELPEYAATSPSTRPTFLPSRMVRDSSRMEAERERTFRRT